MLQHDTQLTYHRTIIECAAMHLLKQQQQIRLQQQQQRQQQQLVNTSGLSDTTAADFQADETGTPISRNSSVQS
jgi:hypothetical protein